MRAGGEVAARKPYKSNDDTDVKPTGAHLVIGVTHVLVNVGLLRGCTIHPPVVTTGSPGG